MAKSTISNLAHQLQTNKWHQQTQRLDKELEENLRELHQLGKLLIFDHIGVSGQVDLVKRQMERMCGEFGIVSQYITKKSD